MKSYINRLSLLILFNLVPLYISVQLIRYYESELRFNYTPELTIQNLYEEILTQGIEHPEIVLKQAILETHWLKCTHCSMQYNNIFGFMNKSGYLKFNSWIDCVKYYKDWQSTFYKGGDYYTFLDRIGYATGPEYLTRLKWIKIDGFVKI
jgi:hypothetical protein